MLKFGILLFILLLHWHSPSQRKYQLPLHPLPAALLGRLGRTCSGLGLLACVCQGPARASQQTVSPVKYCDSLLNSRLRNVGNAGVAEPTSNYLICSCLFLYVQKLEKF